MVHWSDRFDRPAHHRAVRRVRPSTRLTEAVSATVRGEQTDVEDVATALEEEERVTGRVTSIVEMMFHGTGFDV